MGWTKDEVDKYVAKVERNINNPREVINLVGSVTFFKPFVIEQNQSSLILLFILCFRKISKDSPLLGFTKRLETT